MANFKYNGIEYEIPEKFTNRELRMMERNAATAGYSGSITNLLNVLWIARFRVDKKARFEDFDDLTPDELDELLEEIPEPEADAGPPSEAADAA